MVKKVSYKELWKWIKYKSGNMAKILVVDDERAIRSTLKEILEYEKYSVADAPDGIEALELIKNDQFDVILLDIKMPRMDGLEVLEEILKISDTPCRNDFWTWNY